MRLPVGCETIFMSQNKTQKQRYIHLDALRGFAVMGILTMNIIAFAMPQNSYFMPNLFGPASASDAAAWIGNFIFFDGKMRGLFSLLFGASMMLIIMRSDAKGESSAKVHYSRMIWLIIFGLLHFTFIWFGDILFLYGVMGCFAYLMHHLDAQRLLKWGLGIFISFTLLLTITLGGLLYQKYSAESSQATSTEIAEYQSFKDEFKPDAEATVAELDAYTKGYYDILTYRISEEWTTPIFSIFIGITETFPFMLIGMALLKNGFLLGRSSANIYKKALVYGLGGGIILNSMIAFIIINSGFDIAIIFNAIQGWSNIPRLMMTIGYAALIILFISANPFNKLLQRTAAAGRMAFSNYIGTSLVMSFIFYGYGLGYYNEISRMGLFPIIIGAWIIMLLWSKPWLERFHYGPLEWLWRCLARRELQAFRR